MKSLSVFQNVILRPPISGPPGYLTCLLLSPKLVYWIKSLGICLAIYILISSLTDSCTLRKI